ncbi:MAG: response regulator transcription factor [Tidjanibacter sp.]|nr:response regulator transcription factor [Tidjanibacter sp.]MBQ5808032.1 response regulator transcription factor [Tidjanibacter sp.]
MKALIIEDETAAARNLKMLLAASYPEIDVIGTIESVAEAVAWFGANPTPELVFMDIHLADGNSFRIFDSIRIECPIIFTTAYDQYALDAFRVNSIDYLLKPIKQSDLERAVGKLMALTSAASREYVGRTQEMVEKANNKSNSTLLVQVKDKIIPISTDDIAFFYTSNERVSVTTLDGRCYPVDGTLEGHYGALSTEQFFRANRQFIIARRAIRDMSVWFGSRLAVNLSVDTPERIIVSKARTSEFKAWLQ